VEGHSENGALTKGAVTGGSTDGALVGVVSPSVEMVVVISAGGNSIVGVSLEVVVTMDTS
jgi:hypothetical protein